MNTLDYNIKKLIDSGFVQKRKNFFWSQKGKKIAMYELSNKSIVISPKKSASQKFKSILPAFILTAVGTFAVWAYQNITSASESISNLATDAPEAMISKGAEIASTLNPSDYLMTPQPTPIWAWFLTGALLMIFIISIINWEKL
jgi:hypothetical protein